MPIRGIRPCGAKCRTKGGAPCEAPAMKGSNRCRMHFGHSRKLKTHGRETIEAKEERKQKRTILKEMKDINSKIEEITNEKPSI